MKILIVGGGVAGPALAGFLKNDKEIEITLIDKAHAWGDVGFGITMWKTGRTILEKLGAWHDVEKYSYEVPWHVFETSNHIVTNQHSFRNIKKYGPFISIKRTDLHKAITKQMGKRVDVRLNTTAVSINNKKNEVDVEFSDGTKETFDLVVGADGIHSQTRKMTMGEGFEQYSGWVFFQFWTPHGMSSPRGMVEMSTHGRIVFEYPMLEKSVVVFGVAVPTGQDLSREKRKEYLLETFKDFDESFLHLVEAIDEKDKLFRDEYYYVEMPSNHSGRTVFIGDSNHASSPLLGMGASMALEDAYVLAEELRKAKFKSIPSVLKKYEKRRYRKTRGLQKTSKLLDFWALKKTRIGSFIRYAAARLLPKSFFIKPIDKILEEKL